MKALGNGKSIDLNSVSFGLALAGALVPHSLSVLLQDGSPLCSRAADVALGDKIQPALTSFFNLFFKLLGV